MRILAITNLYPNPWQPGRGTPNRHHFCALAAHHPMHVVAPIAWVDEVRGQIGHRRKLPTDRRGRIDGIDVIYPRFYYPPGMLRSCYGRLLVRSIRNAALSAANRHQPEVILASWAYPDGYAAVDLARQLGLPAAVQVLGSDINLLHQSRGRRQETVKTLVAADRVIAVSQALANEVVQLGVDANRVSVVYRGIDQDVFYPGSQSEARSFLALGDADPLLLFVGNLVAVKAVDALIGACEQLVRRFPRLQCHLIGDGPLRIKLQAEASRLSLSKQVYFHGLVDQQRLPQWYRAADLVVLPSLAEGIPNVLIESIACGTPYVASRVGGIPEISKHAGCQLVPPGDPDALATAIVEQLSCRFKPVSSDLPTPSWHQAGEAMAAALAPLVNPSPMTVQRSSLRLESKLLVPNLTLTNDQSTAASANQL